MGKEQKLLSVIFESATGRSSSVVQSDRLVVYLVKVFFVIQFKMSSFCFAFVNYFCIIQTFCDHTHQNDG